jgi:RNase P subunit RPR2
MKYFTRKEAQHKIALFFQNGHLESKEIKKIKRISMTHRIRLGEYRKRFCKKCFSDLMNGKRKISKEKVIVICKKCNFKNQYKIKLS